jgi:hypothetical protein
MATDFEAGLESPGAPATAAPATSDEVVSGDSLRAKEAARNASAPSSQGNGVAARILADPPKPKVYDLRAEMREKDAQLRAAQEQMKAISDANGKRIREAVAPYLPDSGYIGVSAGPFGVSYDSTTGLSHTFRPDDLKKEVKNWKNWQLRGRTGGCWVVKRGAAWEEAAGFQAKVNAGLVEGSAKIGDGGDLTLCGGVGLGYARPSLDVRVPGGAVTRFPK